MPSTMLRKKPESAPFCDLRGYTAFTETAEPEEVLDFLRDAAKIKYVSVGNRASGGAPCARLGKSTFILGEHRRTR